LTCHVDLHKVLVDDATAADVDVSYLGVTHLTLGQTHVETIGAELCVGVVSQQRVPIRCGCAADDIRLGVVATSPTIEDEQ
jgi:hypothetical protein